MMNYSLFVVVLGAFDQLGHAKAIQKGEHHNEHKPSQKARGAKGQRQGQKSSADQTLQKVQQCGDIAEGRERLINLIWIAHDSPRSLCKWPFWSMVIVLVLFLFSWPSSSPAPFPLASTSLLWVGKAQ